MAVWRERWDMDVAVTWLNFAASIVDIPETMKDKEIRKFFINRWSNVCHETWAYVTGPQEAQADLRRRMPACAPVCTWQPSRSKSGSTSDRSRKTTRARLRISVVSSGSWSRRHRSTESSPQQLRGRVCLEWLKARLVWRIWKAILQIELRRGATPRRLIQ